MREELEFRLVLAIVFVMRILPHRVARSAGAALGSAVFHLASRLRKVGRRNLAMALPELSEARRDAILRGVFRSLGWQLAEFCRMDRYTLENTREWLRCEGLENYLAARERGKGVLIVTGHMGAWELSSFYHSLAGFPMGMFIRRLDNRKLDAWVNRMRCLHGNRVYHKDDFARGLLTDMRHGQTVGLLMDTNMTPPQGEFVKFFGLEACTATGLAHVARKTGAAVLPGFMLWEESEQKYVLHFGQELELPHTEDVAGDIAAITQICTGAIEAWIRRYPEQWLWIHRRWKTRPEGEPSLYA